MITKLNATGTWWSSDLYEGNAAFVDAGGTIFVVSQVRQGTSPPVGNTFAVLKSGPVPPDPGPGWSFSEVAAYAFPEPNSSFDPVIAYDGSRYIHIIGTQDNGTGEAVDLLKFTFDTSTNALSGPAVLATASVVREGYDIVPLASGGSFVAFSVTNPVAVGPTLTAVKVTSISISGNVLTVGTDYGSPPAGGTLQPGMDVTFSAIQLATFLNGQTVTVLTSSLSSFTANYVHPDYSQSEPLTANVQSIGIFQNEMTVGTDTDLVAAGWQQWWLASFSGLTSATFLNGLTVNVNSVGSLGNFVGTAANSFRAEFEYPSGSPPDDYCTDDAPQWSATSVYSSGDLAWNQGYLWRSLHSGNLGNFPEPGFWWANYPLHPVPDSGTVTAGGIGESGYAIWLPGHSLLGFELDSSDTLVSPIPTVFAHSPFRSGPVYGSVSVCLGSSGALEAYYESHPKDVSFSDQTFTISETASLSVSSPYSSWGTSDVLTTFAGRYADNRLTVVPSGDSRTACLVYFTQDPQRNSLAGNILLGYLSPPAPWAWKASLGSTLGGSVTQATLSLSETRGPSVSYILSPVYSKRGAWSYSDPTIRPEWQDSYSPYDQVSYMGQGFTCTSPLKGRGWWNPKNPYYSGDIAAVAMYYSAKDTVTGTPGSLPPPEDPDDWTPLGMGATPPPSTSIAWNPVASYAQGTTVYVPAYYLYGGTGVLAPPPAPPLDPANWAPLPPPPLDYAHWEPSPASWPLMTGELDYPSLGILYPKTYGDLSLTWLRGTKSILDDESLWAVVGEANTGSTGSPPMSSDTYYVSHFDVPPKVYLQPSAGGMVYRGVPFPLDASQTYDPDGDLIGFTWSLVPGDPNISLTPSSSGSQVTLLVQRTIGGAEVPVSVAVVADDYDPSTSPPTPNHPPMLVSSVAYDRPSNTATLVVDHVSLAAGEEVLAYGLASAAFLNNAVLTVATTLPSPPRLLATVSFATPAQVRGSSYPATADTGFAMASPQFAVIQSSLSPASGLLVAFNAQPAITMPGTHSAARNSPVTLAPHITGDTDVDDATTYTWTQLQGTMVRATGTDTPVLTFETNGVDVEGETLEWELTVDDGVNTSGVSISSVSTSFPMATYSYTPVSGSELSSGIEITVDGCESIGNDGTFEISSLGPGTFTVDNPSAVAEAESLATGNTVTRATTLVSVPSYFDWSPPIPGDSLRLSRAAWPGAISDRNTAQSDSPPLEWGALDISHIYIDLAWAKRTSILQTLSPPAYGDDRYIVISPYSVLVYMAGEPYTLLRRLLPPAPGSSPPLPPPTVLDAVHTEADYTLVLGSSGLLYRFTSAPLLNTDDPDITLDLLSLSELSFTRIYSTISFAGSRVLALSGPQGCLLLQIDSSTLRPQSMLEMTTGSQLLYGANNVQFVRLASVESLRTGQVFLGTVDSNGDTYETLIDLSQGRIIGTWDKSQLVNQYVVSGEVLFQPSAAYSGRPVSPTLSPLTDKGANHLQPELELVGLEWAQVRPDLCSGYVVEESTDSGATWQLASTVRSGSIESLTLSLARGLNTPISYTFRVQANSNDGDSGYSNTESILL
jgi:hypothetical protein